MALEAKIFPRPLRLSKYRVLGEIFSLCFCSDGSSNNNKACAVSLPPSVDGRGHTALHVACQRIDVNPDVILVLLDAYGCGSTRTRDNRVVDSAGEADDFSARDEEI